MHNKIFLRYQSCKELDIYISEFIKSNLHSPLFKYLKDVGWLCVATWCLVVEDGGDVFEVVLDGDVLVVVEVVVVCVVGLVVAAGVVGLLSILDIISSQLR